MTITVRQASVADARGIGEILVASWAAAYRGLIADDILDEDDVEERTRTWSQRLQGNEYTASFLAEREGAPVGVAALRPTGDDDLPAGTQELHILYLVPEAWGSGAADLLLDRCEDAARSKDAGVLSLWVLDSNARARRFYERRGFVADGADKEWNDRVAVRYLKQL